MEYIATLQKQLLVGVGFVVQEYGFNPKPRGQTFRISKPFGWASIHLSFIPHPPADFDVTIDVALRIDAIENLVNEDEKLLTKSEKSQTATIGCELGNLSAGKQHRLSIASESDVQSTVGAIKTMVESIALPYIERYSNPNELFQVISSNDPSAWLHSPIHGARCKRALAAAVVLKKYDCVLELIQKSEAFLTSQNDFGLHAFRTFSKKIRSLIGS
jgi:hypothetical protein